MEPPSREIAELINAADDETRSSQEGGICADEASASAFLCDLYVFFVKKHPRAGRVALFPSNIALLGYTHATSTCPGRFAVTGTLLKTNRPESLSVSFQIYPSHGC